MVQDKFMEMLAKCLKASGVEAKYDGLYLVVNDCKFVVDNCVKRDDCHVVRFLDSNFRVDDDGENFNVVKAIGLVMTAIPIKLKERQAASALRFNIDAMRRSLPEVARSYSSYSTWYEVAPKVAVAATFDGIEVKFTGDERSFERAVELLKTL